jgi:hypothetical protein
VITALISAGAQSLEILVQALLYVEGFPAWVHGLDWMVGPVDIRGLNGSGLAAAAEGDKVLFQPIHVAKTFSGAALPEPGD